MRSFIAPAIGSVLGIVLIGTPAFAQSTQSNSSQGKSQAQGQSAPQIHAMSQDNLRKQLQQAGFKNIQIIDAAYLVQAQTSDGNSVFMTINPPAMSGSSSSSGTSPGGSSSGSGQDQSGSAKK